MRINGTDDVRSEIDSVRVSTRELGREFVIQQEAMGAMGTEAAVYGGTMEGAGRSTYFLAGSFARLGAGLASGHVGMYNLVRVGSGLARMWPTLGVGGAIALTGVGVAAYFAYNRIHLITTEVKEVNKLHKEMGEEAESYFRIWERGFFNLSAGGFPKIEFQWDRILAGQKKTAEEFLQKLKHENTPEEEFVTWMTEQGGMGATDEEKAAQWRSIQDRWSGPVKTPPDVEFANKLEENIRTATIRGTEDVPAEIIRAIYQRGKLDISPGGSYSLIAKYGNTAEEQYKNLTVERELEKEKASRLASEWSGASKGGQFAELTEAGTHGAYKATVEQEYGREQAEISRQQLQEQMKTTSTTTSVVTVLNQILAALPATRGL